MLTNCLSCRGQGSAGPGEKLCEACNGKGQVTLKYLRVQLEARLVEMNSTYEGCDWCCGGGFEEVEAIQARLDEINQLLKDARN